MVNFPFRQFEFQVLFKHQGPAEIRSICPHQTTFSGPLALRILPEVAGLHYGMHHHQLAGRNRLGKRDRTIVAAGEADMMDRNGPALPSGSPHIYNSPSATALIALLSASSSSWDAS